MMNPNSIRFKPRTSESKNSMIKRDSPSSFASTSPAWWSAWMRNLRGCRSSSAQRGMVSAQGSTLTMRSLNSCLPRSMSSRRSWSSIRVSSSLRNHRSSALRWLQGSNREEIPPLSGFLETTLATPWLESRAYPNFRSSLTTSSRSLVWRSARPLRKDGPRSLAAAKQLLTWLQLRSISLTSSWKSSSNQMLSLSSSSILFS